VTFDIRELISHFIAEMDMKSSLLLKVGWLSDKKRSS